MQNHRLPDRPTGSHAGQWRTILPTFRWALLVIFSLAESSFAGAPGDDSSGRVFLGYLFRTPAKINFKLYTHLRVNRPEG